MEKTGQDLTKTPPAALSRRAFMQVAGGVTLSLFLGVHGVNPRMLEAKAMPLLPGGGGEQTTGWLAGQGELLQLPFWGDTNWSQPEYYETVQAGRRPFNRTVQNADIDGDGRDELLVRGQAGISAYGFSPEIGQWVQLGDGPNWNDKDGWNRQQYCRTMQTADVNGDGRAELLSLGNPTNYTYSYIPATRDWEPFLKEITINDKGALEQECYYQTMQCADIDGDHVDELLIRGPEGLYVWKYYALTQEWRQESLFSLLSDAHGWNNAQYYATIQCADVDNDGKAELLGRGPEGLYIWKFDPVAKTWSQLTVLTDMSDANGWGNVTIPFYSTIQCADIDGDGIVEVLGLIPLSPTKTAGMGAWKFIDNQWGHFELAPNWGWPVSDPRCPTLETIQCADIDGDGQAELLWRNASGMQIFKMHQDYMWRAHSVGPAWSDANGWSQVQHYATIQTARTLKPGDPGYTGDGTHTQSILIGRASQGMQTYRYDTNTKQWVNPTQPFPQYMGTALENTFRKVPGVLGLAELDGGIRGHYNASPDNLSTWQNNLYGGLAVNYDQSPRPNCLIPPPAGISQADWNAVTWQIYWEMRWAQRVQEWYGHIADQMLFYQVNKVAVLNIVGQKLQYQDGNTWEVTFSVLALLTGTLASVLAAPGLGAAAAAAVVGIISRAFTDAIAAGSILSNGGSFTEQYNGLWLKLENGFSEMLTSLATTQRTITGGTVSNVYQSGDYGLLRAIGHMVDKDIWRWTVENLGLVSEMTQGYATEVYKMLFTSYQAHVATSSTWLITYYKDKDKQGSYPSDYPVPSSLYRKEQPIRWLTLASVLNYYPPTDMLKDIFDPRPPGAIFPLGVSPEEFYNARNSWPKLGETRDWTSSLEQEPPPLFQPRLPSLGADLTVSATLIRDPTTNQIVATVTVKNMGAGRAANVEIVETSLNQRLPLASPSRQRTYLIQGRSQDYTAIFPAMASGTTVVLRVSGRYMDGTFGGSFRIKVP